jgi:hypothetical protein
MLKENLLQQATQTRCILPFYGHEKNLMAASGLLANYPLFFAK